ncbi:MAG: hypothetical protein AAFV62_05495 [Pseudomonadota bacterium]
MLESLGLSEISGETLVYGIAALSASVAIGGLVAFVFAKRASARRFQAEMETLRGRADTLQTDLKQAQFENDALKVESIEQRTELERAARLLGEQALEIDSLDEKLRGVSRQAQEMGQEWQVDRANLKGALSGTLWSEVEAPLVSLQKAVVPPTVALFSPLGDESPALMAAALGRSLAGHDKPLQPEEDAVSASTDKTSTRVLIIDLDWRGAATASVLKGGGRELGAETDPKSEADTRRTALNTAPVSGPSAKRTGTATASEACTSQRSVADLLSRAAKAEGFPPGSSVLASDPSLLHLETDALLASVDTADAALETSKHLVRLLASELVAERFDLVMIVAPPPGTGAAGPSGSVLWRNMLAAASHAVVSAPADPRIGRALPSLLSSIEAIRPTLCPDLEMLGVAPVAAPGVSTPRAIVHPAAIEASRHWNGGGAPLPLLQTLVTGPERALFAGGSAVEVGAADDLAQTLRIQVLHS